jgi:general secretion pathway protein C
VQAALDEILRAGLFSGQSSGERPVAKATQRDLKLVGVLAAAPQGRGWAVLQLGGKGNEVAAAGNEFAPGLALHQVFPDHVVLRRQGVLERLDLAQPGPASAAIPLAFGLNVQQRGVGDYAFSRTELDRALGAPKQLSNLGALSVNAEAGVRIDQAPSGSLADKLGLRPGDIIRSVNGQRILSEDDLRRVYEQFNRTQQTAWVVFEGRRNDAPLRLRYTVQP